MFQNKTTLLKLRQHSRHYLIGKAYQALNCNDENDLHKQLLILDNVQYDIDLLEKEIFYQVSN